MSSVNLTQVLQIWNMICQFSTWLHRTKSLRSAIFWDFTHFKLIVLYGCFGTIHRSPLQGSSSPLKMVQIGCPETSVINYQSRLRKISEEWRLHLHRGRIQKSRNLSSKVNRSYPREIPRILWKPCSQQTANGSWPKPDESSPHPLPPNLLTFPLNTILPSTPRCSEPSLSHQNSVCIYLLSHTRNMSYPYYLHWFDHLNNISWVAQIMKPIIKETSPNYCCRLFLGFCLYLSR